MSRSPIRIAVTAIALGCVFAMGVSHALADPLKPDKPANPEKPAKPDGKKSPTIHGTVKNIDVDKGMVTISVPTKKGGTNEQTLPLAKEAQVTVDGSEAKLGDVKTGYPVNLRLNDDKSAIVGLGAEGATLTGELKSVDADKQTVRVLVTTRPDSGDKSKTASEEKTFKLAPSAKVLVDGNKKATLADLKAGSSVAVRLSADGERAFVISSPAKRTADGVKKPDKPDKKKPDKSKGD